MVLDAQLCEYIQNYRIVPFQWVSYMVCKLCIQKNKFFLKENLGEVLRGLSK